MTHDCQPCHTFKGNEIMKTILAAFATLAVGFSANVLAEATVYIPNFNGFFVGVNAGFISLLESANGNITSTIPGFSAPQSLLQTNSTTSGYVGGQFGYGHMIDNRLYLAGKFSVNYSPLQRQTQNTVEQTSPRAGSGLLFYSTYSTSLRAIYGFNAEVGYHIAPTWISYFVGGITSAGIKRSHSFTESSTATGGLVGIATTKTRNYRTGFNLGLGVKHLIENHWLFAAEYEYMYLGKASDTANIINAPEVESESRTYKAQAITGVASISYLFNT